MNVNKVEEQDSENPEFSKWWRENAPACVTISELKIAFQAWAASQAKERERCSELVGDEQFYPNQPESALVNPILHRIMDAIDNPRGRENGSSQSMRN